MNWSPEYGIFCSSTLQIKMFKFQVLAHFSSVILDTVQERTVDSCWELTQARYTLNRWSVPLKKGKKHLAVISYIFTVISRPSPYTLYILLNQGWLFNCYRNSKMHLPVQWKGLDTVYPAGKEVYTKLTVFGLPDSQPQKSLLKKRYTSVKHTAI